MIEGKYIQRFRWITLVSGSVLAILLITAWVSNTWFPSWKKYQAEYSSTMRKMNTDVSPEPETPGIRQLISEGLHTTDRCISCHLGLENPGMVNAPQPYTLHPGDFLTDHPVGQFGCTACHGGQGRAISKVEAHGQDPSTHWEFPLLNPPYIESSCGKCHLEIFSDQAAIQGTGAFLHGQDIFRREGCIGCHKARGVGGTLGPDLTEQGEKTKHEYSFRNIQGEQSVSNWLKEHFHDPEMISPGSDMLMMNLPEDEIVALVTFTMGLAKPDIAFDFIGVEAMQEFRGVRGTLSSEVLYSMACSACHGKAGEGKDYGSYKIGVPAIFNHDFLRVISPEMSRFTLMKGRGARNMASWNPMHSGLKLSEIDSIVAMLNDIMVPGYSFDEVCGIAGLSSGGEDLYMRDCAMCHALDGSGDIGPGLNNVDFLAAASDRFIFNTLVSGRKTAGMPGWTNYSARDMADLISFLRSWGPGSHDEAETRFPAGDPENGDLQYHYLCSRCHGEHGEGNTGPAVLIREFTNLASDRYLYEIISGGRSHTAMFGWSTDVQGTGKLEPQEIVDIISYMREVSDVDRDYIYQGRNPGNAASGEGVFSANCAQCHGRDGEGTTAPALNNQEFLSAATNGYIIATLTMGREGTKMPSWGRGSDEFPALSSSQRKDLAAYIRSWQRFRIRK